MPPTNPDTTTADRQAQAAYKKSVSLLMLYYIVIGIYYFLDSQEDFLEINLVMSSQDGPILPQGLTHLTNEIPHSLKFTWACLLLSMAVYSRFLISYLDCHHRRGLIKDFSGWYTKTAIFLGLAATSAGNLIALVLNFFGIVHLHHNNSPGTNCYLQKLVIHITVLSLGGPQLIHQSAQANKAADILLTLRQLSAL